MIERIRRRLGGDSEQLDLIRLLQSVDPKADRAARKRLAAKLVKHVERREELHARVLYNLACYEADGGAYERSLERLEESFQRVHGAERAAYVDWAQKDPSLEVLGKRVARDFRELIDRFAAPGQAKPIGAEGLGRVEQIGAKDAKLLADKGITTWRALRDLTDAKATELGFSKERASELREVGKLLEIRGLGPTYTNLLIKSGIETRGELAQADPDTLHGILEDSESARKLTERVPSRETVGEWVRAARRLEGRRGPRPR